MPVIVIKKKKSASREVQGLRRRLVQEWRKNSNNPENPIIVLDDKNDPGGCLHIYVVWDQWESLNQQERSETIMDAAEEVLTKKQILNTYDSNGIDETGGEAVWSSL
ncbi:MAG: hypothetical protein NTX50_28960 [Candidatus Sumerlaeota bacterium]|nr:hypothetical protein [Candidatus Sumerlaeota bacterium]